MSDAVTLADIERLCWHLSGWSVDQRSVSSLLAAVEAYAQGGVMPEPVVMSRPVTEAVQPPAEGPVTPVVDADPPQPLTGSEQGVQRHVHAGEITLRVLVESPRPVPVRPVRSRAAAAPRPEPVHEKTAGPDPSVPAVMRACRKCSRSQPLHIQYHRDARAPEGRKTVCRTCEAARKRTARTASRAEA